MFDVLIANFMNRGISQNETCSGACGEGSCAGGGQDSPCDICGYTCDSTDTSGITINACDALCAYGASSNDKCNSQCSYNCGSHCYKFVGK